MRKEEILKKAQKETDEMEQAMLMCSLGISTIIIPILCTLFIAIRILYSHYLISDLVSLTLAQLSISQLYQYAKMKKTILLFLGILTLVLSIIFMISFINEVKL